MNHRNLGKTGFKISEVSLGTWQLGGRWGEPFNEKTAEEGSAYTMDCTKGFDYQTKNRKNPFLDGNSDQYMGLYENS